MADPLPATPQPQSMEAILASIKRIMDEPAPAAAASDAVAEDEAQDEDVLELGPAHEGPAPAAQPMVDRIADEAETIALVSPATRAATTRAMASLAAIALDPNAPPNTLDGLVRDMLRPMLKAWLDANLPDLVERVVAREVARLGGR